MSAPTVLDDDEVVTFLAAPVPRLIPVRLRKVALRESVPVSTLFLAAVLITFGLVFTLGFFPRRLGDQFQLDRGEAGEARGRIVSVEDARLSINKEKVYGYEFEFTAPDGRRIRGDCFTSGRRWGAGETVSVRYAVENPDLACVQGARLGKTGAPALVVLVLPLAGVAIIVWWKRARRRVVALLTHGTLGDFRVKSVEPTGVSINKQPQFKVILEQSDGGGSVVHTVRWHQPNRLELVRTRQQNGKPVFGLFDPARPNGILLPELWRRADT
jgi:hypothetical protein